MPGHAFHQLYYHFTWTPKHRLPVIAGHVRDWLLTCLAERCNKRDAVLLARNAMPDRVCLLFSLRPTGGVAAFSGQVKPASARLFTVAHDANDINLVRQTGYGAVTLRKGEPRKAIECVNNEQAIHAARKTPRILEPTWDEE